MQPAAGNQQEQNSKAVTGKSTFGNVALVKRNALTGSTVTALDMQGRVMGSATLANFTQLEFQNGPPAFTMLRFAKGKVVEVRMR